MKKAAIALLLITVLAASCKKDKPPVKTEPAAKPNLRVLNITDNSTNDTVAKFIYSGRQLVKVVRHGQTDLFNYDASGRLAGTTILNPAKGNGSSVVTYDGDNIAHIKFTNFGRETGSGDYDVTLTYKDGKLESWFNSTFQSLASTGSVKVTYVYDSKNNNTTELIVYQAFGNDTATNDAFDDKYNITDAIPFWIYFRTTTSESFFTNTPGAHNSLSYTESGSVNTKYTYQYNSYGYPSTITDDITSPGTTYKYDYENVN